MIMLPLSPDDRPEIEKAVVIATLSAIAAELVVWAFDEIKESVRKRREGAART